MDAFKEKQTNPHFFKNRILMIFESKKEIYKLVTSNENKLKEYKKYLPNLEKTKGEDIDEVDSDDETVIIYKAIANGPMTISEDTSLEIDGEDVGVNIRWLLDNLKNMIGKNAKWKVLIGKNDGKYIKLYEGVLNGKIVSPTSQIGFGFDPYFQPNGFDKTLNFLKEDPAVPDHKISARSKAAINLKKDNYIKKINIDKIPEWKGKYQKLHENIKHDDIKIKTGTLNVEIKKHNIDYKEDVNEIVDQLVDYQPSLSYNSDFYPVEINDNDVDDFYFKNDITELPKEVNTNKYIKYKLTKYYTIIVLTDPSKYFQKDEKIIQTLKNKYKNNIYVQNHEGGSFHEYFRFIPSIIIITSQHKIQNKQIKEILENVNIKIDKEDISTKKFNMRNFVRSGD